MVWPHELLVRIEQNPELSVAARDPDGQDGRLKPWSKVEVQGLRLVRLPDEEADIVATLHAHDLLALQKRVCGWSSSSLIGYFGVKKIIDHVVTNEASFSFKSVISC